MCVTYVYNATKYDEDPNGLNMIQWNWCNDHLGSCLAIGTSWWYSYTTDQFHFTEKEHYYLFIIKFG